MNTKQLKEFFAEWQSAKVDSHYPTITFEESDMLEDAFSALSDRLAAAERERDDLKQRLANAEHQLHMAELAKFNLRNQRKAQFRKRREAEAELVRRDAAAGEPDYWQFKSVNGDWIGIGDSGMRQAVSEGVEVRPLYTAAWPAVLPYLSDETLREMVSAYNIANHSIEAYEEMRAAMCRGAQQQKVVELPDHKFRECVNGLLEEAIAYAGTQQLRARLSTRLSNFVKPQHAENVKWEVKK